LIAVEILLAQLCCVVKSKKVLASDSSSGADSSDDSSNSSDESSSSESEDSESERASKLSALEAQVCVYSRLLCINVNTCWEPLLKATFIPIKVKIVYCYS